MRSNRIFKSIFCSQKSLRRADRSSRGVLPSAVRLCVRSGNLNNGKATAHAGPHRHEGVGGPYFNCYPENTGLLENKSENRMKVCKLCVMKYALVSPQCNFHVEKTDVDTQMFQLIITDVPNNLVPTYVHADFQIYSFCLLNMCYVR